MRRAGDEIIGLYERHAAAWDADRQRGPFLERSWLERFSALVPDGASILDLGCGSGAPIARHLAARGLAITGVDASPTLIALCRERLPGHDWRVGDMRALALPDRFHGVIAWDSLFHLAHDDQRGMFATFRAHARPGAALLFTSGDVHGEAIGTYGGEALYHASLAAAEYRALLGGNGFGVVAHVADDVDCGRRTVWLARRDPGP
jgi:SAM-dependent methyltransferase